jgi:hypothetical protein
VAYDYHLSDASLRERRRQINQRKEESCQASCLSVACWTVVVAALVGTFISAVDATQTGWVIVLIVALAVGLYKLIKSIIRGLIDSL